MQPLRISRRPLESSERAEKFRDIYFFQRRKRAAARAEFEAGFAEVLEFSVAKAWNLITCGGPPCCANAWLVQTVSGELVRLESWRLLSAVEGAFPGRDVRVSRFPATHRIAAVEVSGPRVPARSEEAVSTSFLSRIPECEVIDDVQVLRAVENSLSQQAELVV